MPRDVAMRRSLSPEGVEHEFVYGRGIEAATFNLFRSALSLGGDMDAKGSESIPSKDASDVGCKQPKTDQEAEQHLSEHIDVSATDDYGERYGSSLHLDGQPGEYLFNSSGSAGLSCDVHSHRAGADFPMSQERPTSGHSACGSMATETQGVSSAVSSNGPSDFFLDPTQSRETSQHISSPTGWSTDRRSAVVIRGQRLESNSSKLALPRSKVGRPHSQIVAQAAKRVLIGTTVRSKCD